MIVCSLPPAVRYDSTFENEFKNNVHGAERTWKKTLMVCIKKGGGYFLREKLKRNRLFSSELFATMLNVTGAKSITIQFCLSITSTHDLLIGVGAAGVGGGHCGGAVFGVPGRLALLWGAGDGQCVDTASVAVTVTVVTLASTIAWCPHVDHPLAAPSLQKNSQWYEF